MITFDNSETLKMIEGISLSASNVFTKTRNNLRGLYCTSCAGNDPWDFASVRFKDKGKAAKTLMTQKEDEYLALFSAALDKTAI